MNTYMKWARVPRQCVWTDSKSRAPSLLTLKFQPHINRTALYGCLTDFLLHSQILHELYSQYKAMKRLLTSILIESRQELTSRGRTHSLYIQEELCVCTMCWNGAIPRMMQTSKLGIPDQESQTSSGTLLAQYCMNSVPDAIPTYNCIV